MDPMTATWNKSWSDWAAARRCRPSPLARSIPVTAFAAAFAGTLFLAQVQNAKPFYYDSGGYWSLGGTFISHGNFSLTNFDSPLRGYILPLVDHGLHGLAVALSWRDSTSAKLFNVFLFAFIGTVLVPELAKTTWPTQRWNAQRRLLLVALLLIFWSGYLNFPLSDFPALTMTLIAILAVSRPLAARWMLLAGIAAGVAIDMRPSYLLLIPTIFGLAAWGWYEQRGDKGCSPMRVILYLGLTAVGFVAVSLPQSLSAHRHFGTYSFVPGSAANLEATQLTEGVMLQLYGTYVGPGYKPEMDYIDDAGARLLATQPSREIKGAPQYLGLVLDHPLTFVVLFVRHTINGLDVRYSTPYVEHLRTDWWLRAGGFFVIFTALLRVLWPATRRGLGRALWRYPVALLACSSPAVSSAVETRYMLPVFILGYTVMLASGWPSPVVAGKVTSGGQRRLAGVILLACLVLTIVTWLVTGATTHALHMRSL